MYQEQEVVQLVPAHAPSPAVLDLTENLRARIYSIFYKLGEWF